MITNEDRRNYAIARVMAQFIVIGFLSYAALLLIIDHFHLDIPAWLLPVAPAGIVYLWNELIIFGHQYWKTGSHDLTIPPKEP